MISHFCKSFGQYRYQEVTIRMGREAEMFLYKVLGRIYFLDFHMSQSLLYFMLTALTVHPGDYSSVVTSVSGHSQRKLINC